MYHHDDDKDSTAVSISHSGKRHLDDCPESAISTAVTTVSTATPSVTATTTSSSSSSFRVPTTTPNTELTNTSMRRSSSGMIHNNSMKSNSSGMINNNSHRQPPPYCRSSSHSRDEGQRRWTRNIREPSMQSIQISNFSSRVNNNNYSNNTGNSSSSNSNSKSDSLRWDSSAGGSHKLLFTLNDSVVSFAASHTSYLQINGDHHDDGATNHDNVKPNRRPSVFTTLSGGRFYLDDAKGEPIPVPPSAIIPPMTDTTDGCDPHTEQVRRQSGRLSGVSNLSTSQHHANQSQQPQQNMATFQNGPPQIRPFSGSSHQHHHALPHPAPLIMKHQRHPMDTSSSHSGSYGGLVQPRQPHLQAQFRNHEIQPHSPHQHFIQHDHKSEQHDHFVPQQHQRRSSRTGEISWTRFKSIAMIDRIPPPASPLPPRIRGMEMSCKMDILHAPIGRRSFEQYHQQGTDRTGTTKQSCPNTSVFTVGTPILSTGKNENGYSSSRRIPYHSHFIQCPKCHGAMIVSKHCIVVQCPQCRMISPCESTALGITNPDRHHNISPASPTPLRYVDPSM